MGDTRLEVDGSQVFSAAARTREVRPTDPEIASPFRGLAEDFNFVSRTWTGDIEASVFI